MIRTLDEVIKMAKREIPCMMAVAVAQDGDVLQAVNAAAAENIIRPILVGDKREIVRIADREGIHLNDWEIIDELDKMTACIIAASLVRDKKASLLMKGFVDTSCVMKAVLSKENDLKKSTLISHVAVIEVPGFDRLFYVSDSAMNIDPILEEKEEIIRNTVEVAHALGNECPKVAVLCAVEKVNQKMSCTLDAQKLTAMNERGEITGCMVKGPLALDNAISPEAAKHKGIESPVAGYADILITPDIEAGNMLNKSMEYFAHAKKASVMMGAKVPIVLISRASSAQSKMYSIAISALIASVQERSVCDE